MIASIAITRAGLSPRKARRTDRAQGHDEGNIWQYVSAAHGGRSIVKPAAAQKFWGAGGEAILCQVLTELLSRVRMDEELTAFVLERRASGCTCTCSYRTLSLSTWRRRRTRLHRPHQVHVHHLPNATVSKASEDSCEWVRRP